MIARGGAALEPILKTENLWKMYRTGRLEVPALRGVSISILPGEFVSIMGPSGCGKSTLLHVIGGLAQATSGRVLLDGNDLTEMSDAARTLLRRHKVGFVFQRFNLLPTLDAYHNIALAQHIHGNGFDPHRFEAVTGLLGLADRLRHKPSELSGGEQQRVALARAIISEPKIVLADEPTGNLDTKSSEAVLALLRQLNKELGQTIVMITHNPEAADLRESRAAHARWSGGRRTSAHTEMRSIWRGIVSTIFWSYERGSWPYDVLVVVIVIFVLATPRSWFHDRPQAGRRRELERAIRFRGRGEPDAHLPA